VIVVRRQAEHDQASSSTSRRFFAAACAKQRAVRRYRALCEQNSFCRTTIDDASLVRLSRPRDVLCRRGLEHMVSRVEWCHNMP
jgi:hypothetical protein